MKKIILSLFAVFCISCSNREISESNTTMSDESYGVISLPSDFWEAKHQDTKNCESIGKYEGYMTPTDFTTTISSSKKSPLDQESVCVRQYSSDSYQNTKLSGGITSCVLVTAEGKDIRNYNAGYCTKGHCTNEEAISLFGKKVSFEIGSVTKSGQSDSTIELYIPEIINITAPEVKSENEMFPLCYYDGFVLKWNPDLKNENGVLVVVEWYGTMVFGADNPDAYVRHVDLLPDNGEAVLSNHLFDDIPDTALCHLMVIRGDLENVIIDNASHKLVGETHASLPFVLIRELSQQ